MLYSRKESEHKRFAKLVDAVGKRVAKTIKPGDVSFDVWHRAVASYRSEVVAHPQGLESDDSRILDEGRAFTHHMEFLLKAYVLERGLGIKLSEQGEVVERLKHNVTEWNDWDWRNKREGHAIY